MYDKPLGMTYTFQHDFGAATEVQSIQGPAGATGVLREISLNATETFNSVTTAANIQVGTAADPNAYAQMDCADTADTDSISAAAAEYFLRFIPADTQVEVTFTAPTGGTPTGIGSVFIAIDWNAPDPHTY